MTTTSSITAGAERILTDVIEYLTEEILMNPENRLENYKTLEFFWAQLQDTRSYGRLFARYRLAKIVTAACHVDPYNDQPVDSIAPHQRMKNSLLYPALPLAHWSDHHWQDLCSMLESMKQTMLRRDVDSLDGVEDDTVDLDRSESDLYQQKLDGLIRYIQVNRALAGIRWDLQQQLDHKQDAVKLESSVLAELGEKVATSFPEEDDRARQALESLLVRSMRGTSTRSHGVSLRPPDQVRAVLAKKPFELGLFQNKLESLMKRWARDAFSVKPALVRTGYTHELLVSAAAPQQQQVFVDAEVEAKEEGDLEDEDEIVFETQPPPIPLDTSLDHENDENDVPSKTRRPKRKKELSPDTATAVDPGLERLQNARRDLQNDGKDPMQEIQAIAARATRSTKKRMAEAASSTSVEKKKAKTSLYDKKVSAQKVQFDDSDDDDSDDGVHLSELPARAKVQSSRQTVKANTSPVHQAGKRKPYSEEEKRAIREGVKKFGVGKWSAIKADYSIILRHRTSVNIKDCYRTMKNKGEV